MEVTDELRRRFAEEYTLCHSPGEALRRASDSVPDEKCILWGSRLLRDDKTRTYINQFMEQQSARCLVTRDMVVAGLLREANDRSVGSTHGARVNAWTQLGKMHEIGLFNETLTLKADKLLPVVNVNINRDTVDDPDGMLEE